MVLFLATIALEAGLAETDVLVDAVHALGPVPARVASAVVDVNLAVRTWTVTNIAIKIRYEKLFIFGKDKC